MFAISTIPKLAMTLVAKLLILKSFAHSKVGHNNCMLDNLVTKFVLDNCGCVASWDTMRCHNMALPKLPLAIKTNDGFYVRKLHSFSCFK